MVLDRHWLLGVARREREALGRTIQYTDLGAWENPGPWQGRPIIEILYHLAATEIAAAEVWGGEAPAELDEYRKAAGEDASPDGFTHWALARRAEQSAVQTAREWGRAADLLLDRATATSDEDWRDRMIPWFEGDLRAGYFLQYRVAQWWLHGQDILDGSAQALRREHDPTFVVNDFAVRLIPYALSLTAEDPGELVVRVDLDGVGGGVWLQSTRPGPPPPEDATPSVIIGGRGPWLALVASGRVDPDVALYEGVLNVGGDLAGGEMILRSLRAYP
ncbi:MAG TPA: hypothetical protein VF097_10660 [Actinomycetota bacterium]